MVTRRQTHSKKVEAEKKKSDARKEKDGKAASSNNNTTVAEKPKEELNKETEPKTPPTPQLKSASNVVQTDKVRWDAVGEDIYYLVDSDEDERDISEEKRGQLYLETNVLKVRLKSFYFGPEDEKRTCVWSGGDPFSWTLKTCGVSWVGINGTESAFVAAMEDVPVNPPGRTQLIMNGVMATAICDMGVWADTSTEYTEFRRRMIAQSSSGEVGPFAVVSVAPGTEDRLATRAINFLTKKLKDRSALNHKEMKQIAVCALKCLLGRKFDAKLIEIRGSGKGGIHDHVMYEHEVEEHLAAIKKIPNKKQTVGQ